MQKAWKIILTLSIIINLILGFILSNKSRSREFDSSIYTEKIDSLELELFTLQKTRDSIRSSIDTVIIEINKNEKNYEESRDIILSNSVSDDYMFFTEYLSKRK